jgi:hypothetical protein
LTLGTSRGKIEQGEIHDALRALTERDPLSKTAKRLLLFSCLAVVLVVGWYVAASQDLHPFIINPLLSVVNALPFVDLEVTNWAIGIYEGDSPVALSSGRAKNPVLSADDVTDAEATFVADPFIARENETWYMFLEVLNSTTDQGDIAYATSEDGRNWTYQQIVLDEPFHTTYPYVFEWQDEWYLVPETHMAEEIRLYRATDFPTEWSFAGVLLEGAFSDPSLLRFDDKWWLFTSPFEDSNHRLRLYYADELLGPWIEHPESPIVDWDANIARPGGRVLLHNGQIIRYAQDAVPRYGTQVYAFEITELTPTTYEEEQIGSEAIIAPGNYGWNARSMHHVDPHLTSDGQWIASVDGRGRRLVFEFGND